MVTTAAALQVFVGADISQATKGLTSVSKSVSSFTGDILKTAAGVGLATLGLDAFGNAADFIRKASGVGLALEYEDVNAQLTAMLGSGEAAADVMATIRKRADETPFGFLELSKAAAGLIPIMKRTGAPLEDMLNTELALASFDPAQGLEGAGIALREFASGDIQSLRRRFEIDTDPIEKLIAKGVPGLKALNTVLGQSGIDLKLVEARAKTTGGRLNTFQDLLGSISLEAGKPILAAFGLELDRTSGLITANLPALQEFAATVGTRVAGAMTFAGTELGTILQTATNISKVHGIPFLDALGVATELRVGELFGPDAAAGVHGFTSAIHGIPATLESIKKFFDTDFKGTFDALRKDFAFFIIGLSDLPGLGGLKDRAAELRKEFGITPEETTLPFPERAKGLPAPMPSDVPIPTRALGEPATGAPLTQATDTFAGLLTRLDQFGAANVTPFVSAVDRWLQNVGHAALPAVVPPTNVTLNTQVNTGPVNASDPEDVARMADALAAAQRRQFAATGAEAPGA